MSGRRREPLEGLPIAECRLDLVGVRAQRDRYRAIGRRLERIDRHPCRLTAQLTPEVDEALVEETVEVERGCCPFFSIDYDRDRQRLSIEVSDPAHDPALDALRHALTGGQAPA